jgi:hypothetical protein
MPLLTAMSEVDDVLEERGERKEMLTSLDKISGSGVA